MLGVLVEPILLLSLWVAAQVAGSTHISNIADTIYHWPVARSIPLIWRCAPAPSPLLSKWASAVRPGGSGEQELQEGR